MKIGNGDVFYEACLRIGRHDLCGSWGHLDREPPHVFGPF